MYIEQKTDPERLTEVPISENFVPNTGCDFPDHGTSSGESSKTVYPNIILNNNPSNSKSWPDVAYSLIVFLEEFGGLIILIMFTWYFWLKLSNTNINERTLFTFLISITALLLVFKVGLSTINLIVEYVKLNKVNKK